jgi:NRAMP (natural resistance-associated macrophage protein)-like metal ion transporter
VAGRPRAHSRRHHLRGFGYFRALGPGLVTGASDDDPSGIGTYSQVGAAFGFGLLWTTWFTLPLAAAVQETAGRLGLVTGRGLASLIKERFPRWVLIGAVVLVSVANTFNIGADIGSMGSALQLVLPIPFAVLVVAITLGMLALEVFLPYRRYTKVLRWLTLSLGAYIAVLFVIDVDWRVVLRSTFIPSLSWTPAELAALIAILGTTISPYLFFWQSANRIEELRAEPEGGEKAVTLDERSSAQARLKVKTSRLDVLFGMTLSNLVMFAIIVATGATLGADGGQKISSAADAAKALEPVAGSLASVVFAGLRRLRLPRGSVLAGSGSSAMAGLLNKRWGFSRSPRKAPVFYGLVVVATIGATLLSLLHVNPIALLVVVAVINGVRAAVRRDRDAHRGRRADHGDRRNGRSGSHAGVAHVRASWGSSGRAVRDPAVTCAFRRFGMTRGAAVSPAWPATSTPVLHHRLGQRLDRRGDRDRRDRPRDGRHVHHRPSHPDQ